MNNIDARLILGFFVKNIIKKILLTYKLYSYYNELF